jgi:hypothetical protein
VSFVTFNYDTSLEHEIRKGASAIETFGEETASEFLAGDRVLHIYGSATGDSVGGFVPVERPRNKDMYSQAISYMGMVDTAHTASKDILTIAPNKTRENEHVVEAARERPRAAKWVYIIGYGFDPQNSNLLMLRDVLTSGGGKERVCFTNKGDSNRVNKRASKILYENDRKISSQTPLVDGPAERSERDVYGALCYDFDLPS